MQIPHFIEDSLAHITLVHSSRHLHVVCEIFSVNQTNTTAFEYHQIKSHIKKYLDTKMAFNKFHHSLWKRAMSE